MLKKNDGSVSRRSNFRAGVLLGEWLEHRKKSPNERETLSLLLDGFPAAHQGTLETQPSLEGNAPTPAQIETLRVMSARETELFPEIGETACFPFGAMFPLEEDPLDPVGEQGPLFDASGTDDPSSLSAGTPFSRLLENTLRECATMEMMSSLRRFRTVSSANGVGVLREEESSTLLIPRTLTNKPRILALETHRIVLENRLRSWMARYHSGLASLTIWALVLDKYAAWGPSLRAECRREVESQPAWRRVAHLFESVEKRGLYRSLLPLVRLGLRRPGMGDALKQLGGTPANLAKRVLAGFLWCRFACPDGLEEYSQGKWLHHDAPRDKMLQKRHGEVTPVTVDIVPSLECPQDCFMCSNVDWRKNREDPGWVNKTRSDRFMNWDTLRAVIDRLAEGGCRGVVFTGGGEPLTNPNTIQGIRYARERGMEPALYTNGILLDESVIAAVMESQAVFVRLSINAGSEETHAHVGGYDPARQFYKRVMENLRKLATANAAVGSPVSVGISFIVNPRNIQDMERLAADLRDLDRDPAATGGVHYLALRPTVAHRSFNDGKQFSREFFDQARDLIRTRVVPLLAGTSIKIREISSRFDGVAETEKSYRHCVASPWFSLVGPDASMYLCVESYYGHKSQQFGDLKTQSLNDVFTGAEHRAVVDQIDFKNCPPVCKMHELNKIFDGFDQSAPRTRRFIRDWFRFWAQAAPVPRHVNFL